MMINNKQSMYYKDNISQAKFVKKIILDNLWWEKIHYTNAFTKPTYDMLRVVSG